MKVDPEGREEYTGLIETDRVENRVRTRIRLEFSLTAEEGVISGDLQEKTIVGNSAETTAVKAELERKAPDEYHGSLEITHNMDKIEKEHFRFLLTAGSCDALKWTAGQAITMTEEGQAATAEKAARVFLKALKNVPEEDLQYFLADLPAGTWKQIIGNTEEPEETEQP